MPGVQPYEIFSLTSGHPPLGIDYVEPMPPHQFVHLNGLNNAWGTRDGFVIDGYPYLGVIENKVAVSTNKKDDVEWEHIFEREHNAWYVARRDNPNFRWTVDAQSGEVGVTELVMPPDVTQLFTYQNIEPPA